jgi:RNA polymerase sigma factor (sigma-70 family)
MAHAHAGAVLRHLRRRFGTSDLAGLSDRELLQRFTTRHDEAAFETLLQRHGPLVLGVCRRVLADRHAAEDAFQATFVVLVRRASAIAWRESVAGWLFEVARRIARQARTAAARHPAATEHGETMMHDSPISAAAQRELRDVLDEELQRLPEKYRAPVVLCYLEGKSNVEAARLLGWTKGTVSGRLARARDLLRQRLARRGWGPAAGLAAPVLAGATLPSAVPAALADAATRAALQTTSGAASALPAGVALLANRAVRDMAATRLRILGMALLALAAVGTGIAVLAQPADTEQPVAAQAPDPAGPPAEEAPPTDRYGDPLPAGAFLRLGTLRFRHELLIHSLAVAPDGKSIASGGSGHAVRLWDAATGKELRRFPHGGEALDVAFAPDGKSLAFTSHPHVLLCDAATGKELQRFTGHTNGICGVAFAPDGRVLASASHDKTVRLWDTATGKELVQCQGHEGTAWKVAFFPDGKMLASAGLDKTVRLWEASTGKELARLEGHTGEVCGVAIAPDGKTLASGSSDKTVRLWDVAAARELRTLAGHQGHVNAVVFSPDGKTLASGSNDSTIRFWDVATGKEQRRIEGLRSFAKALAFLPDGHTLASGGVWGSAVQFWDVATGKEVRAKGGHEGIIWSVRFAADDRTVYSVSADRTCRVWSAANGEEVRRVDVRMRSGMSADGELVASWTGPPSAIRLWDVTTGEEQRPFEGEVTLPWSLTFSPDSRLFASACQEGVVLWDMGTGRQLRRLGSPQEAGPMLAFTPDGKALLTGVPGEKGDALALWDVGTGKQLRRFPGGERGSNAVAFSPDGKMLAAVGEGREEPIHLWEVASGKELFQLSGHTAAVFGLAFSPDGRLLASTSEDKTVRVWELASDRAVKLLRGHQDGVLAVAFSHDGTTLATGSSGEILLWDLTGLRKNGRPAELHLSGEELERAWRDLGGADGPAAFQAFWRLTASPHETTAFLGEKLKPVPAADPARIARLIADLDSEQFTARDAAGGELEQLAEGAEPALRKLLAGQPSPEARRRAEMLVRQLEGPILPRERLQQERALAALARIGSPEARRVFAKLAEGTPDAWLTQQAKATLERLEKAHTAP